MERHARFERLAQQEVGAVERVSTEREALVQATAAAATPPPVDASGGSASQARAAQLRRYTPNRFVVRLFAPQVALLLLLALLGYLCFGGQSTVHLHDKHIHLSVGPGCMPRPKTAKPVPAKYNAIDNVTCEVDAPQTQSQIGPTVTMCVPLPCRRRTAVLASYRDAVLVLCVCVCVHAGAAAATGKKRSLRFRSAKLRVRAEASIST